MPSNDDVVWGLPHIQCPSCQFVLQTATDKAFHKLSKAQRKTKYPDAYQTVGQVGNYSAPHKEDQASDFPENTFIVVTCTNECCEQYSKLKALRVPRIHAPSIKLDL